MAVGDVVSQTSLTSFTFQPASGVQVCITQFIATTNYSDNRIQGRGNIATTNWFFTTASAGQEYYLSAHASTNHKFFIDNTSYLYFYSNTKESGFSGIQTQ
jgi:hypothetical protein